MPQLSHTLLDTWKRRRNRHMIFAGYAEVGRMWSAIAHTAETTVISRAIMRQSPATLSAP